jgi:hypothetical protein
MSYKTFYAKGDWNAICDICGRQFKASQMKQRWDGFMTCIGDWEPRQPQDFVRGVADTIKVPWSRPDQGTLWPSLMSFFVSSSASIVATKIPYTASGEQLNAAALNTKVIG